MSAVNDIEKTDTAHLAWEEAWKTEEGRKDWLVPEPFVARAASFLEGQGCRTILDLGCGVGRHAIFLAERGFKVHAIDGSPSGIDIVRKNALEKNHAIHTDIGEMTALPYPAKSFDAVLAWNVIYHGDLSILHRTIAEIYRVLTPEGFFVGTMLSKRNHHFPAGTSIGFNTVVNADVSDKSHPHFYVSARELLAFFTGFEPCVIEDAVQNKPHSWHFNCIMQKTL